MYLLDLCVCVWVALSAIFATRHNGDMLSGCSYASPRALAHHQLHRIIIGPHAACQLPMQEASRQSQSSSMALWHYCENREKHGSSQLSDNVDRRGNAAHSAMYARVKMQCLRN
jgi:hypothetical protein